MSIGKKEIKGHEIERPKKGMKINILCENHVGHEGARICKGEWGLSVFIEIDDKKILFDTGASGLYWENAVSLKIPIEETDLIVLSHSHWDHSGGLPFHQFKSKKKILMHPDARDKLEKPIRQALEKDFEVLYSKKSTKIAPNLFFLGEIPRVTDFEKGMYKDDHIKDDTALVYKTERGCVIITGCSHSGICNICEQAKKISGQKILSIIGGFHLMKENRQLCDKTIAYLKQESPESLYPLHCVDFEVQCMFNQQFDTEKLSTGDQIIL